MSLEYYEGNLIMKTVETTRGNGTRRIMHVFERETKTEKSHQKACNINTIMAKAIKGQMPLVPEGGLRYGDFSNVHTFQSAMDAIVQSQMMFDALPSNIRKRFHNDPSEFVQFMEDEDCHEEAIRLGLKKPEKASQGPVSADVPTTSPVPSEPATGADKPKEG